MSEESRMARSQVGFKVQARYIVCPAYGEFAVWDVVRSQEVDRCTTMQQAEENAATANASTEAVGLEENAHRVGVCFTGSTPTNGWCGDPRCEVARFDDGMHGDPVADAFEAKGVYFEDDESEYAHPHECYGDTH